MDLNKIIVGSFGCCVVIVKFYHSRLLTLIFEYKWYAFPPSRVVMFLASFIHRLLRKLRFLKYKMRCTCPIRGSPFFQGDDIQSIRRRLPPLTLYPVFEPRRQLIPTYQEGDFGTAVGQEEAPLRPIQLISQISLDVLEDNQSDFSGTTCVNSLYSQPSLQSSMTSFALYLVTNEGEDELSDSDTLYSRYFA